MVRIWSPAFAGGQDCASVPSRDLATADLANYLKGKGDDGQHCTSLTNVMQITPDYRTTLWPQSNLRQLHRTGALS